MRTTIVPAQVTTVEDKITGNLSVIQLLLLILPVLIGGILFVALPPFFNYAVYKIVIITCILALCASLAVRIKGKIALQWLIIFVQFNLRPKHYVFDVNDTYLKEAQASLRIEPAKKDDETRVARKPSLAPLRTADLIHAQNLLSNPAAQPRFEITRKGAVNVRITEIK